jgi:4-amino-4-deoxy-L-arabinose transferase-like glycosyltransferase
MSQQLRAFESAGTATHSLILLLIRALDAKWLSLLVPLALILSVAAFVGANLGRFPLPYIDESFWIWPAISYLHGHGFVYQIGSSLPYTGTLWAYHGPLYPHLLVFVFKLFGFSLLAARLTELLPACAAVCMMVYMLWKQGNRFAPLAFALVWLGDRAPQELEYARVEGCAILCVVLAFLFLQRFDEKPSGRNALSVGFFGTMALAFHPVTAAFLLVNVLLLAIRSRRSGTLPNAFLGFFGGVAPACLLVLACVQFRVLEALQQFQAHLQLVQEPGTWLQKLLRELSVLRWSKWFFIALVIATLLICAPIAVAQLRRLLREPIKGSFFTASLALYSVAGLVCLISKSVHPYYIVYFSIWPIALLVYEAERHRENRRCWALALILALAWVPSAAWNVMRARDVVINYRQLRHDYIVGRLKRSVPPDAPVDGDPLLLSLAEEAGLNYTPTAWYAEKSRVPDRDWILVRGQEYQDPLYFFPADEKARGMEFCADAFPGARQLSFDVCLLRPLNNPTRAPGFR